jgi:hypothetical protein
VRQQLQLNNRQFNQLNSAYQRAYQRYAQGLQSNPNATAPRRQNLRNGTSTRGAADTANRGTARSADANVPRTSGATAANPPGNVATQQRQPLQQQEVLRRQQLRDQFLTDFNSTVDATFTDPAMRQRYNQLNWQFQGLGAFNDPGVQQQLNLTAQQRQQLTALQGEWRRDLMNLQRNSRTRLTQEQFDDFRRQFMSRLNTVLTPEQQQLWMQLVGQQYDFPVTTYFPSSGAAPLTRSVDGQGGAQRTDVEPAAPQSSATQTPQNPTTVR